VGKTGIVPAEEFSEFYRRFVPTLVAFLRWQGVPLRDAADVAQETMIEAYRLWSTIEHPQAWARRVASRMWARRLAAAVEEPVANPPDRLGLLAITDVAAWEQRHEVLRILDQLPARQRQVLAWRLDGYQPAEIAAELRMTADAVRSSLLKARRAVARQLRDGGRP
jgi:RNA polymerase sigma factor (sigma-70 family)